MANAAARPDHGHALHSDEVAEGAMDVAEGGTDAAEGAMDTTRTQFHVHKPTALSPWKCKVSS
eukprot:257960-Chlamydomonas_euryale.AAC.1